jgi:gas vesicle protein
MGQDSGHIREEIEQTRTEMGSTVDALAHKADVKSRVKESFAEKRDRLRAQMTGTASRIGEATPEGGQVKEGAQRAVGFAEENPIGLALGGVATGFLVGMMLPTTRVEDERIGPIADQVKDEAKETGQEALQRGKEVAGQVAETAKEAGQQQAEELKSSAQESASNEPHERRAK